MQTCHQAGSFAIYYKDMLAPSGLSGKLRIGILPSNDIMKEVQRIITHNGLRGVFPTNINASILEAPDEIADGRSCGHACLALPLC